MDLYHSKSYMQLDIIILVTAYRIEDIRHYF